jgi:quercetin dioxygenase-like cupin family protein
MTRTPIALALALSLAAGPVAAEPFHVIHEKDVPWGPAPDSLPKGAQFALISGDPVKPGPFAFRLKMPPGYVVMPHSHPAAENLTVISGRLYHGMGDTLRKADGKAVAQGDFVYLPPAMPHAVWTTDSPAVIQVNGTGPFSIHYVRAEDDPRNRH